MADGKTPKDAPPTLKRSSRRKAKYAAQYRRTYENKHRRIRKHNGERFLRRWMETATGVAPPTVSIGAGGAKKKRAA